MTARTTTVAGDAERRLQREYEPLKAETLRSLSAKLRARGIRLPDEELDEYYNQAWHALYLQAAAGTEIANTGGFLVQVAFRRVIDDFRRMRPDERADVPLEQLAVEQDVVQRLDDQRRLREFAAALREELGERERVAASLCYIHGYTRPQAARVMGLSERRMQKVMDALSKAIGRITREIEAGQRCEARASQNKAYALGLLDPGGERHAAARAHLDECARCRADVLGLRGLAIVSPPPLLPWAAAAVAGGGAAGGAGPLKRRRSPRPKELAVAAAAVAAVALAALAAAALTRDTSDAQPGRVATAPGASPTPSSVEPSASPAPAPASKPERDRAPKRERRPQSQPRSAPSPQATPAGTAEPAQPAPTPSVAPAPAAEPPVLDDGVQEFGVER